VTPASVALGHSLVAPLPGTTGTLTTNNNSASFVNGVGTKSIDWSEVGILNLNSTHTSYLGSGANTQGNVCNVGRFIPAYFSIASPVMNNRSDIVACADPFTYMNENFRMDFNLSAFNARTPAAQTQNYTGSYAKLNPSSLTQMNYGATEASTNLTARLNVISAGVFANGTAPIQATTFFMRALAVDGPYNNLDLGIAPTDSDGITLQTRNLSLDGGPNTHFNVGQTAVRYGRLALASNYGSELLPLSMQLSTQYYADATSQFVINPNDNCTAISTADVLLFNSLAPRQGRVVGNPVITINGGNTTTLSAISPIVNGITSLNFTAPSAQGYVDVEVQTPAYLLSNLDGIDQGIQGPGQHCTPGMAITEPAYIPGCV
ncbi:MAG TPA: DUF6701 domain-containing protein, partial [Gammaproteobacteria bacterium]|nr:DUF6701 domain-containing protein [Gammaproteobacteria bacterium]